MGGGRSKGPQGAPLQKAWLGKGTPGCPTSEGLAWEECLSSEGLAWEAILNDCFSWLPPHRASSPKVRGTCLLVTQGSPGSRCTM